jgi:hypothetical protein
MPFRPIGVIFSSRPLNAKPLGGSLKRICMMNLVSLSAPLTT